MRVAVVTGVGGQDGFYLSEFLLEKGYMVYGLLRRTGMDLESRLGTLLDHPRFSVYYCDLADQGSVLSILSQLPGTPDEIYNLAAQSHVGVSFQSPSGTALVTALGALHVLDSIVRLGWESKTRFYQASTSELFGSSGPPQKEETPMHPRSPYAIAKLYAYWTTIHYREARNLFAVNGILFNHESPRRSTDFVTRKVTRAAAHISRGLQKILLLGNLDSKRDWGAARDYVRAMWLMLQRDVPEDLVIGTGVSKSVRELVVVAFSHVGLFVRFVGSGSEEQGLDQFDRVVVKVDSSLFRICEVENLQADCSRARVALGWGHNMSFEDMISEMVESDLKDCRAA